MTMTATFHDRAQGALEHSLDVDTHEMVPAHKWGSVFGETSATVAELVAPLIAKLGANDLGNVDVQNDDSPMTERAVWETRGVRAPGAFDFSRRLEAMDLMGVDRQLIFPSYAFIPLQFMLADALILHQLPDMPRTRDELRVIGRKGVEEYNEWAVRITASDRDRLRPVALLLPTSSVGELLEHATDLVDRGIRAVHINNGIPPAGLSPADPALDPVWSLFADHDVAVVTHVNGEGDFLKSPMWGAAPPFIPGPVESFEIDMVPYAMATLHLSVSNFLICLTLGGVFERHPRLRFGVIENTAHWFGPLARSLDMWARDLHASKLKPFLSKLPSEYFAANVRVTPFVGFEPIEEYFRDYPELSSCYCYSSDYPHVEGGKNSKARFLERVAPLGADIVAAFFRENAALLLPD